MTAAREIALTGTGLTMADTVAIGEGRARIVLPSDALARVAANRTAVEIALAGGERIYGAGPMIAGGDAGLRPAQVEHDIVRGTAAGIGEPLPAAVARAAMAVRLNGLLLARSGVRPALPEAIAALLNAGLAPHVPARGSAGASGDLAPSAHAFLTLLGEGYILGADGTGKHPAADALAAHGLTPFTLAPKEAIAILNGTHFMTALGAVVSDRVARILDTADAVAAMTIDALRGFTAAFDLRVHALRPLPGQIRTAEVLRRLLSGSARVDSRTHELHDAYTLRCVPQVHGAARHGHEFFSGTIAIDLNAATDNPLIFDDPLEVVSAGNFHGQSLSLAFDVLRIALADLAAFSERRLFRLVSPSLNGDLPPFLVGADGRGLGYMVSQFACTTVVAELRVLAQPVSIDTVPTLDNIEDHVSFGMTGGLLALQACDLVETVLAIEAMAAAQALETGPNPAPAVAELRALFRETVPPASGTRPPADDMAGAQAVLRSRVWADALGGLLD